MKSVVKEVSGSLSMSTMADRPNASDSADRMGRRSPIATEFGGKLDTHAFSANRKTISPTALVAVGLGRSRGDHQDWTALRRSKIGYILNKGNSTIYRW